MTPGSHPLLMLMLMQARARGGPAPVLPRVLLRLLPRLPPRGPTCDGPSPLAGGRRLPRHVTGSLRGRRAGRSRGEADAAERA